MKGELASAPQDPAVSGSAEPEGTVGRGAGATVVRTAGRRAASYLLVTLGLTTVALSALVALNRSYAPEMYRPQFMGVVAEAFAAGENYAVFDLNINIRKLREEQLKRLNKTPAIVVLGASQWQEASADLLPGRDWLNAHVHRDYYEDALGMTELLVRTNRLPKDLVITIRDNLFTPVGQRTDFLWLPGVPYYRAMAKRLSLQAHPAFATYPLQRPRELISLPMLFNNATRWHNATDFPYPTTATSHKSLDLLKPDGSIRWSDEHQALFTRERSLRLAIEHANRMRNHPPKIDPDGVAAFDSLLSYLGVRGVRVHLAHPPFNPEFYDRVQDSPYLAGLREVEAVTLELAAKHKLGLVGSFDPADLGCTSEMYIDAEHSNAQCLSRLLADVGNSVDLPRVPAPHSAAVANVRQRDRARQSTAPDAIVARGDTVPTARTEPKATQRVAAAGSGDEVPVVLPPAYSIVARVPSDDETLSKPANSTASETVASEQAHLPSFVPPGAFAQGAAFVRLGAPADSQPQPSTPSTVATKARPLPPHSSVVPAVAPPLPVRKPVSRVSARPVPVARAALRTVSAPAVAAPAPVRKNPRRTFNRHRPTAPVAVRAPVETPKTRVRTAPTARPVRKTAAAPTRAHVQTRKQHQPTTRVARPAPPRVIPRPPLNQAPVWPGDRPIASR